MAHGFNLLTPGNPKVAKGEAQGFWTFILHLAPAKLSGYNVCAKATTGCIAACLNTAGRGGMMAGVSRLSHADVEAGLQNAIQKARIRRTKLYFEHRQAFMTQLVLDVRKATIKAAKAGLVPVFRLNGTSDIPFENVPVEGFRNIMERFAGVQFYDYTKRPNRSRLPANYHLTFSLADGNAHEAKLALANGMNVAAVFRDKQTVAHYEAQGFMGSPVFNGDETDLRFLDPAGHVIALYAKGNAKRDASGFVQDMPQSLALAA